MQQTQKPSSNATPEVRSTPRRETPTRRFPAQFPQAWPNASGAAWSPYHPQAAWAPYSGYNPSTPGFTGLTSPSFAPGAFAPAGFAPNSGGFAPSSGPVSFGPYAPQFAAPQFSPYSPTATTSPAPSYGFPNQSFPAFGLASEGPACDIFDEGADLVIQVDLPGVKPEGLELHCTESAVSISAMREADADVAGGLHIERPPFVAHHRTLALPTTVRPEDVRATLRDGVLTVNLPKAAPTQAPRRVEVQH